MSANVCVDVFEIEMQAERRRGANHAIAVEHDELAVGEQFEMLTVVRRLEAFGVSQRRETNLLQRFELLCVLRSRVQDGQTVGKTPVVPHQTVTLYRRDAMLSTASRRATLRIVATIQSHCRSGGVVERPVDGCRRNGAGGCKLRPVVSSPRMPPKRRSSPRTPPKTSRIGLLTVGETARILGVSPSTLRLWESVGLVSPARGDGRYRLYSPELLDVLKRISTSAMSNC